MASTDNRFTQSVQSALASYGSLSDEERRLFFWSLQNPTRAAQAVEPPPESEDPWQVFTLADAYLDRPPVEYVAEGLFALPSLNIVYGAPGTLKSFLLADLSVCAAAGSAWLPPAGWTPPAGGTPPAGAATPTGEALLTEAATPAGSMPESPTGGIPTRLSPAMWLDFDNGRRRTHDRFGALGRARGLPPETHLYYYSMPNPWLNAGDKASIGSLSLRMLDRGVKFVVVDNLGVVSGDADENSVDMVGVMSEFRQLAEETGAAVVLIHHQRKSNGSIGRAGDSLRGHSSIEAALDLALMVEREELADTISIKATKVRGADVLPFSAVFTCENRPDGQLQAARFFGITADDTRSGSAIEREILSALNGASLNKTDLTKSVKEALPEVGLNRIRDRIDRMATAGKLRVGSGKNNTERVYSKLERERESGIQALG